jgi:hypothetical protein
MKNKAIIGAMAFSIFLTIIPMGDTLEGSDVASAEELIVSSTSVDFFISPQGEDHWSGKLSDPNDSDGPFKTVERAQEAVRALLRKLPKRRPVRVVLRGGTYYLKQTLEFGPEDSGTEGAPVVYAAAHGEKVVISGGCCLAGGKWGKVNGHKAWVIDIPDVKEGHWNFRQLFVSGVRRPRTRLPEEGFYKIKAFLLDGYFFMRNSHRISHPLYQIL